MTPLDAALDYASRGWRVINIIAGDKRPRGNAWQQRATTDEATIQGWFSEHSEDGIGIATGAGSGLFVLDVDVAGDKIGDISLRQLEGQYGELPRTVEAITGSGGRHIFFRWPAGAIISNSASSRLGPDLDIRGEGGQVVAAPTVHPNGQAYAWDVEHHPDDVPVAEAPTWLLSLLTTAPEPVERPKPAEPQSDRPGDLWAAATSWAEILQADGWTLHHIDRSGEEHWTRPGKDVRDGTSATVNYGGSDTLKIFTSSVPELAVEATYTKIGYLAAMRHGGDHAAAARALRAAGHHAPVDHADPSELIAQSQPQPEDESAEDGTDDWLPVDLAPILAGKLDPPQPTILAADGHPPLLYPGRVNSFFGESGAGKTWAALAALAECMRRGRTAILIDLEDSAHGIIPRLRAMGVDDATIAAQFVYLAPQTPWRLTVALRFAELIEARNPELVAIDSTGEAMAMSAVKGNDDDDVARWFSAFPRRVARLGPAVLILDHIPKDPNAPGGYAIGSQRKKAAIDGASYRVDAIKRPSRTDEGLLKIVTAKDRNGARAEGSTALMMRVVPSDGRVTITLEPPDGGDRAAGEPFRPTVLMQRVSRFVEMNPGCSQRDIRSNVEGKEGAIKTAIDLLVTEDWVEMTPRKGRGGGWQFTSLRAFSELSDMTQGTGAQLVPTGARHQFQTDVSGAHRNPLEETSRGSGTSSEEHLTPPLQGRTGAPVIEEEPGNSFFIDLDPQETT